MFLYFIIIGIVVFDQWTKWLVKTSLRLYQSEPVIENFFHLTYVTNEGMAFGLTLPGGKHILLILTILLTGFIIGFLWKERNGHPFIKYGLALILSGAIGNLIDRILYGKVVDFIDIMFGDFHWYIFNIADSSVTIGMFLFILHSLFDE
tara:strand:- start:98 stop:544 length:447 start_codon:yes stop_codon:yes gene_type:complete